MIRPIKFIILHIVLILANREEQQRSHEKHHNTCSMIFFMGTRYKFYFIELSENMGLKYWVKLNHKINQLYHQVYQVLKLIFLHRRNIFHSRAVLNYYMIRQKFAGMPMAKLEGQLVLESVLSIVRQ